MMLKIKVFNSKWSKFAFCSSKNTFNTNYCFNITLLLFTHTSLVCININIGTFLRFAILPIQTVIETSYCMYFCVSSLPTYTNRIIPLWLIFWNLWAHILYFSFKLPCALTCGPLRLSCGFWYFLFLNVAPRPKFGLRTRCVNLNKYVICSESVYFENILVHNSNWIEFSNFSLSDRYSFFSIFYAICFVSSILGNRLAK